MWIFLPDGFLSVVSDKDNPKGERLLVRSRHRSHISTYFPEAEIIENAGSDYRFRAWLPRTEVTALMVELTDELDYCNFKNQVVDDDYHNACLDTWSIMHRYQTWQEHIKKQGFAVGKH